MARSRRSLWLVVLAGSLVAAGCAGVLRASGAAAPAARAASSDTLVVVLHGMGRSPVAMAWLSRRLSGAGFRVLNLGYDSYTQPTRQIEASLARRIAAARQARPAAHVHFVGHSLGGVLALRLAASGQVPGVGRIVQLAPPNRGAQAAARMTPWMGWLQRPMRELRPGSAFVASLPAHAPEGVEVAVVAAREDGKVRVDETRLDGAVHAVTPGVHTFLMLRPDVIRATVAFLRTGTLAGMKA